MICKKCANIFDDSLLACPACGWSFSKDAVEPIAPKRTEPFKLNIDFDEKMPEYKGFEPAAPATPEQSYYADASEISAAAPPVYRDEEPMHAVKKQRPKPAVKKNPAMSRAKAPVKSRTVKRTGVNKAVSMPKKRPAPKKAPSAPQRQMSPDVLEQIKKSTNAIVIIMCVVAVMMVGITVLGAKTDVFTQKDDTVKTVALSGLSNEDKLSVEAHLAKLGIGEGFTYDSRKNTADEFLGMIKPYDKSGLYGKLYSEAEKVTDVPDAVKRFKVLPEADTAENSTYYSSYTNEESYAYYKIEQEKIDRILELFGLNEAHTANTRDCYYYDGYYYFAHSDDFVSGESNHTLKVADSKRIQDGSYYVECTVSDVNSSAVAGEKYLVVSKSENADGEWIISRCENEPIFSSDGKMNVGEDSCAFEMKQATVEAKTDDGTVYCRYTVRYPSFSGQSGGEQTANRLFVDMMNAVNSEAENAQKQYKSYIDLGGDKEALPFESNTECTVSYNEKGYISIIRQTTHTLPDLDKMKEEYKAAQQEQSAYSYSQTEQAQETLPALSKVVFEAYTLDKQSGDFVTKDNIIGKDYQNAYDLLYRIYNGYDYAEITDKMAETTAEASESTEDYYATSAYSSYTETTKQYPQVPADSEQLGMKIYESANTLCDEGYVFCFVNSDGYAQKVVIPFSVEGLFLIEK